MGLSEVVALLKDKRVSSRTFTCLRKMKPLRQIEAAELMISGKNYATSFANAILGVTSPEELVKPRKKWPSHIKKTAPFLRTRATAYSAVSLQRAEPMGKMFSRSP